MSAPAISVGRLRFMPLSDRQEAQRTWRQIAQALPLEPARVYGPLWGAHPLPMEKAWRMETESGDLAGWLGLEWGPAGVVSETVALSLLCQRRGLRESYRRFAVHQAFEDLTVEVLVAEVLRTSPYYGRVRLNPGAPWRILGEMWLPRPKVVIGLSRADAIAAGVIPWGQFAPSDPFVGQLWIDAAAGDRWKIWTGEWWDRLGARSCLSATVIEHPFWAALTTMCHLAAYFFTMLFVDIFSA